jgi:hypothetical protein
MGPQYGGRMLWRNNVIAAGTMGYLKRDLHRCGLVLTRLSELSDRLGELLDVVLEVVVRNKDDNTNVYLNKRLEAVPEGMGPGSLTPF